MALIVVLTGGGIKGATAAARSAGGNELLLVQVDYGQPSAQAEASALHGLAATLQSSRVVSLNLPHVLELDHAVTDGTRSRSSGEGEGSGEPQAPSALALRGIVPVLLSVGVQCALRVGASTVVTGLSRLCGATHLGLPGNEEPTHGRREFVHSFNLMIESVSQAYSKVQVETPLMDLSFPQIIKLAERFGVPLEKTWSCARSTPQPCGGCEPCRSRAGAFLEAGLVDPLTSAVAASA